MFFFLALIFKKLLICSQNPMQLNQQWNVLLNVVIATLMLLGVIKMKMKWEMASKKKLKEGKIIREDLFVVTKVYHIIINMKLKFFLYRTVITAMLCIVRLYITHCYFYNQLH